MDNKLVNAFNKGYMDGKSNISDHSNEYDKEYSDLGLEDFSGVIYHTSLEAYQAGYKMGKRVLELKNSEEAVDTIIDYE